MDHLCSVVVKLPHFAIPSAIQQPLAAASKLSQMRAIKLENGHSSQDCLVVELAKQRRRDGREL